MAQAARQRYGYHAYAASATRSASPERASRPDVRVIPGRRSENPAFQSISDQFAFIFKASLVAIAAIALVCGLRVWLSATTVSMLDNVNTLQGTLASAQATTNELEIQHSILSSSTRIEEEATNIGMHAPDQVKYLKVVVYGKIALNQDGSISLASTLQNIENYVATTAG